MRLGIGSFTYPWAVGIPGNPPDRPLDAFGILDKARSLGLKLAQFGDNLPLSALSLTDSAKLARQAEDSGMTLELGTRGIEPDHLLGELDLAVKLKSRILRVVVDKHPFEPSPEEVVSILRTVLPRFTHANVVLAIENHDRFTSGVLADIVRKLNSPYVGICLDTVNSFGALEGPEVVVKNLGPLAVNLHIKDFAITRSRSQLGFSVTGAAAGARRLNVPWLLKELKDMGRDPNAIIELWTPFGDSLSQTIQTEERWAKESVEYLRTLIKG